MSKFQKPRPSAQANEKAVNAIIERGGQVPKSNKVSKNISLVQLRLATDVLTQIDDNRLTRHPKPSRHSWLLEAIYEKLQREES